MSVKELRARLDDALRRNQPGEVLLVCAQLEMVEPREARWPHRRGDALRRAGRKAEAITAYERAADLYASQGFVARAVAMARVVLDLDASRIDLMKRIDPDTARAILKQQRPGTIGPGPDLDRIPPVEPPPGPRSGPRPASEPPASASLPSAITLYPAPNAPDDAVLFDDAKSIELDLSELEVEARDPQQWREDSLPNILFDELLAQASAHDLAELPAVPLLAQLPRAALVELGRQSEIVDYEDRSLVLRAGDAADALFAIVEGHVFVDMHGDARDVVLGEGDVFGESCLLEGFSRTTDVRALGRVQVLRIPRVVLDVLVERYPGVRDVLFELLTRRVVGSLLRQSAAFADLDPPARKQLARQFEVRRAPRGTLLVIAGKRSDGLYVVLAGRLELTHPSGETLTCGPGTLLGQRTLLAPHLAAEHTVLAETDCLLLRLPVTAFEQIAQQSPGIAATVAALGPGDVHAHAEIT